MKFPTAGQFVRNNVSDTAKVAADAGKFWDEFATHLIEGSLVPKNKFYRWLMFVALSYVGAFAQVNLNDQKMLGKLLMELVSDMPSELAKRVLEHSRTEAEGTAS